MSDSSDSRRHKSGYKRVSTLMKKKEQPLFTDISQASAPTVVESMCTQCQENGTTTILLTKIPFFRDIIITSFSCPHCNNRNSKVEFAGQLPDYGVDILFRVLSSKDLGRQLIKSEHTVIKFEEIDLEIPQNGKAQINTIEGYLRRTHDELAFHQPLRRVHEPENYEKLQVFLEKVREYMSGGHFPLTVRVRDPSGNSHIKNPFAPQQDKNMEVSSFLRSLEEFMAMGYSIQNAKQAMQALQTKRLGTKINFTRPFEENNFMNQEPVVFEVPCHSCLMPGQMRTCQISVPYFSDLVVMSFRCQYCGAHSTQTKSGGQIKKQAAIITLEVKKDEDLKRDLFKSQTCGVQLPEIELELQFGTLGGVFTTVEGLIEKIYDHFKENNPFVDSDKEFRERIDRLLEDLLAMRSGNRNFTLTLVDPLAHSFISSPYLPDPDPRMKIQFRDRTDEQNDDLGLNDMKVQNYTQETKTQPPVTQ